MCWTFDSTRIAIALVAIEFLAASPLAAQANLERIVGTASGVRVQQAGVPAEAVPTIGMLLQPGDILRADKTASVELRCTTKGATTYRVTGPFRLFIDVPVGNLCNVDLTSGQANIQAEEPSNITGGTVPLASKGTEYSVDVSRQAGVLVCKVVVFEGEVFARQYDRAVVQGNTIQWAGTAVSTGTRSAEDIDRTASIHATFDLAAAQAASPGVATAATYAQLKALHYAVLANPTDTAKRVELAKRQIDYKVDDQAAYNLKRANVTSDTALRRYQIDPKTVRENPAIRDRIYKNVTPAVVRPEATVPNPNAAATVSAPPATRAAAATTTETRATSAGAATVSGSARTRSAISRGAASAAAAPPAAAPVVPTTDSDLALIAGGQIDAAIQNLESRVAGPYATSRDHYALAKAYDGRDAAKVVVHAGRALSLHVTDAKLTDADLQAIRELMSRVE